MNKLPKSIQRGVLINPFVWLASDNNTLITSVGSFLWGGTGGIVGGLYLVKNVIHE